MLLLILLLIPMIEFIEADELEDNFYAISKSNNPTQWILQGNETLEEELFNDNISKGNFDLYGSSERSFLIGEEQSSNYLLDNFSIGIGYEWEYTGEKYYVDVSYLLNCFCWDGEYWYISDHGLVYKFNEDWEWIYHDQFFDIRPYTLTSTRNIRAIEWNGSSYFVLFDDNYGRRVVEYDCIFVKYPSPDPTPLKEYWLPAFPWPGGDYWDIAWDGINWWVLRSYISGLDEVYKFFSNWTYTGTSYNLEMIDDIAGFQTDGYTLVRDGSYWWIGNRHHQYKMYLNFTYTGIRYDRAERGFIQKDSFLWGLESDFVYKYFSKDSIVYNISKNYHGNGYAYVQTYESEEIGLIGPVYNSNISLKSGDYFIVEFETNMDSEIKLDLINNGLEVEELELSPSQIFLDSDVEFDQIRFTSSFKDQDYLKIFDIKCYNVSNIAHYAEFYVDPFQSYSIYLTPTTYNLKILEEGKIKVDENICIESPSIPYYYTFYSPVILINSPYFNELFGNNSPSFNIEIKNNNGIDQMWYTLDNGVTNTTFTTNGAINQDLWDSLSNGTVIISFYVKDSIGNMGNNSIMLRVDKIGPFVKINSPLSNELFESTSPVFNVETSDANLNKMWYTINGEPKKYFFLINGSIDLTAWSALPDGIVTIQFYANDTLKNIGFAEITIRKDVDAPVITIINPQNNNVIGATTPNFEISIEELNLDMTWYSLNGGNNVTFTGFMGTINQALWDALPEGNVIIRFYANDTLGRIGFQEVTVVKRISQTGIPGYNLLLLLGFVLSTVAIIIVKKRLKHLN